MQSIGSTFSQNLYCTHADAQVLIHAFAVKMIGHAGQFDFTMQRLVAHAEQGTVGHAEAETIGGNGGGIRL